MKDKKTKAKTKTIQRIMDELPLEQRQKAMILFIEKINKLYKTKINWREFEVYESAEKYIKAMLQGLVPEHIEKLVKEISKLENKEEANKKKKEKRQKGLKKKELKIESKIQNKNDELYNKVTVTVRISEKERVFVVKKEDTLYGYILISKEKMKKIKEKAKKSLEKEKEGC